MNRNWWSLSLRALPVLLAALALTHPAFAMNWHHRLPHGPVFDAPEIDPRIAITGLAAAAAAAAIVWERLRRRR
jgi:hypothetical protein